MICKVYAKHRSRARNAELFPRHMKGDNHEKDIHNKARRSDRRNSHVHTAFGLRKQVASTTTIKVGTCPGPYEYLLHSRTMR